MKLIRTPIVLLISFVICAFVLLSTKPLVSQRPAVSPADMQLAWDQAKKIHQQLFSTQTFVELEVTQDQLASLSTVASHTLGGVLTDAAVSQFGLRVSASVPIGPLYLNLSCMMVPGFNKAELTNCSVGHIPLHGAITESLIRFSLRAVFGDITENMFSQFIEKAEFSDDKIVLKAIKKDDLRAEVKSSLGNVAAIVRTFSHSTSIPVNRITHYLDVLSTMDNAPTSLAYYMGQLFGEVQTQVAAGLPSKEEATAATWALSIKFGTRRFAGFAKVFEGYDVGPRRNATLRGRQDLALHFIYTLMIEQLGKAEIAFNVAELKELLDTNTGGSGYSFADLAAGHAGLKFSELLSSASSTVEATINILAFSNDESLFFPLVHDLPEGYRENEFGDIYGGINSPLYKQLEQQIDERVLALPIFKSTDQTTNIQPVTTVQPIQHGRWLVVDTHSHTKFSDGSHTVAELADNAEKFGCDALAITDHADRGLPHVAAERYFQAIRQADYAHPNLKVLAGIEWNIAPFMGREHVTLLLPESPIMEQQLAEFRKRFDSYGQRFRDLISAEPAFRWLDRIQVNGVKPIVMYNHPSRKSNDVIEAYHDMSLWQSFSDVAIGFSGAPGHQKRKGENNGSYEQKIKTVDGWDPVAAIPGGVWDKLLADGRNVWSARAPSDFHNTKMDYWPCEFSTTHLFAQSSEHNDILAAFRAGKFWAQHGKFIDQLFFTISTQANISVGMGETIAIAPSVAYQLSIQISMKMVDWQYEPTSIDQLELIRITDENVTTHPLSLAQAESGFLSFSIDNTMADSSVVYRLRGASHKTGRRSYWFYSNPIRLTVAQ